MGIYVIDKSMKPRISQDAKVNTIGKYLVNMCISCRLRFLNGRHRGDYWGKFTCFTLGGCNVVDYVIVSAELNDKVADFSVGELPTFSDHCPLKLAINLPLERNRQFEKHSTNNAMHSLLQLSYWNDQVRVEFDEELKQKSFLYQRLKERVGIYPPHILAQEFQNILIGFIQKRMKSTKQPKSKHSFPRNLWFDEECKAEKRSVNNAKKVFLQYINTLSRKDYILLSEEKIQESNQN